MTSRLTESTRLLAAAVFGGVLMAGGVSAAATGSLPGAGHDHGKVPATHQPATPSDETDEDGGGHGKGATISELAHTDGLTGVEKGAAICTEASNGRCRAGQQGKAAGAGKPDHVGRPAAPKKSGATTSSTRSGARSDAGLAHRPAR